MKHPFRRLLALLIALFLIVIFPIYVSAENVTAIHLTSSSTSNSWKEEPIYQLSSPSSQIYGGDVGIWYYSNNVGLPSGFIRSTSRKAFVQLWENDYSFLNPDEHARSYRLTFATVGGYYRPYYVSTTYTNPNVIEEDSVLELYMKFYVQSLSGDTSSYIPAGIIKYRFWTYS